jgi:NADH:ubiquinone oxidoreductase subunit E
MPPERATRARYRELIKDFKPDSGHLLACLHRIQHEFGYIPTDAVPVVAQQLRTTPATIFGAITYYSEFSTTPPPRVRIDWCSGPICRLKGGDHIRRALEATLGVAMEENTPDNRVGLHLQQCDGSCEYAPLVWLKRFGTHPEGPDAVLLAERGEVRGRLRVPDAIELARALKAGDGAADGPAAQP